MISTRIWFVTEPGTTNFGETYRATFPMTDQEAAKLHAYAQDVAAIQRRGRESTASESLLSLARSSRLHDGNSVNRSGIYAD